MAGSRYAEGRRSPPYLRPETPALLVQTDSLSKRYGRLAALVECSFGVERGEILGLLGPNGAGKTTLLRLLLGYLQADGGAGDDRRARLLSAERRRASAAVVPAGRRAAVSAARRPRDAAAVFAAAAGASCWSARSKLAERLQLDLSRRVGQMSTGMRQKLALVVALAPDVPLVILDEPTSNLDPTVRREVIELIRESRAGGQDGAVLVARAVGGRRRVRPRDRAARRAAGRLGARGRRAAAASHPRGAAPARSRRRRRSWRRSSTIERGANGDVTILTAGRPGAAVGLARRSSRSRGCRSSRSACGRSTNGTTRGSAP